MGSMKQYIGSSGPCRSAWMQILGSRTGAVCSHLVDEVLIIACSWLGMMAVFGRCETAGDLAGGGRPHQDSDWPKLVCHQQRANQDHWCSRRGHGCLMKFLSHPGCVKVSDS